MLVKEIIQRIQSLYSRGVQSSNSRLTSRHIYNKLLTVRSRLLYQQAAKKQRISDWNYQTISCVEMITVPVEQCPCIPPSGCEILRSKYKLPSPIMNLSSHMIKSVMSLDGSNIYSEITLKEKKYKKGSKYTANKPDYFIQDGYIYITHRQGGPKLITITGLFDDPTKVKDFESYCGSGCIDCDECKSPMDTEFPIDGSMIEVIIEMSVTELIQWFKSSKPDNTSNSRDDDAKQKQESEQ